MKISKKDFIKFFNQEQKERLNSLKDFLKGNIETYFKQSNQATQDQTKLFSYMINDIIYDFVKLKKGLNIKEENNGYDINYKNILIESKITKANEKGIIKSWTGNKASNKVPIHILIGYTFKNERIDSLFIGIIDTSKTSGWKHDSLSNSSYSNLDFTEKEAKHMHILIGSVNKNKRKNALKEQFITEKI